MAATQTIMTKLLEKTKVVIAEAMKNGFPLEFDTVLIGGSCKSPFVKDAVLAGLVCFMLH